PVRARRPARGRAGPPAGRHRRRGRRRHRRAAHLRRRRHPRRPLPLDDAGRTGPPAVGGRTRGRLPRTHQGAVMPYYARTEVLRTLRNKRYAIFVVIFPVTLYLINAGIYGDQDAETGVPQSVYLMVSMACYGALSAAVMSTAMPWAQERASGWADQLRVTPLPGRAVVAVKAGAALLLVLPALALV